jgi:hypothetical protein
LRRVESLLPAKSPYASGRNFFLIGDSGARPRWGRFVGLVCRTPSPKHDGDSVRRARRGRFHNLYSTIFRWLLTTKSKLNFSGLIGVRSDAANFSVEILPEMPRPIVSGALLTWRHLYLRKMRSWRPDEFSRSLDQRRTACPQSEQADR